MCFHSILFSCLQKPNVDGTGPAADAGRLSENLPLLVVAGLAMAEAARAGSFIEADLGLEVDFLSGAGFADSAGRAAAACFIIA